MPRRAPTRVLRALAATGLVLLVLGASACNPGRPPAATVEGQDISTEHLDAIVDAYMVGDPEQFASLEGTGRDTIQMAAASSLLANLISQVYQAELAEQMDAVPTDAERQEAESLVESSFVAGATASPDGSTPADPDAQATSTAIYEALPDETREWLVDLRASTLALLRVAGEGADVESQSRALYDADPTAFDQLCIRAIIVEPDGLAAVQDRLATGEDFGAVSADVTVDEALAAAGGELGQCLTTQQLVEAGLTEDIVSVVSALEVGEVSEPVDLGDGFAYLFELRSIESPPVEEVLPQIAATLPDPGEAALQQLVTEERPDADITVDPRFGEWDGETGQITPPPGATAAGTVPADLGGTAPPTTQPAG